MNRRVLGMVLDVLQRRPAEAHRVDAPVHVVCGPRADATHQAAALMRAGWRIAHEVPLDVSDGVAYAQGELARRRAVDAQRAGRVMLDNLERMGATPDEMPSATSDEMPSATSDEMPSATSDEMPSATSETWVLFLLVQGESA